MRTTISPERMAFTTSKVRRPLINELTLSPQKANDKLNNLERRSSTSHMNRKSTSFRQHPQQSNNHGTFSTTSYMGNKNTIDTSYSHNNIVNKNTITNSEDYGKLGDY